MVLQMYIATVVKKTRLTLLLGPCTFDSVRSQPGSQPSTASRFFRDALDYGIIIWNLVRWPSGSTVYVRFRL